MIYTKDEWSIGFDLMGNVLNNWKTNNSLFYLAQHRIFDQIPDLQKDVKIPDYSYTSKLTSDDSGESLKYIYYIRIVPNYPILARS